MAVLKYTWSGDGIARMSIAMERLEGPRRKAAFRRALNHTGNKAFTSVQRTLSKQMNVAQARVNKRLRKHPAHDGRLEFLITSSGKAFRLLDVNGTRVSKTKGVTSRPWGETKRFPHAFSITRYGGNIFQRKGKDRFPIFALWGPNINKQIVKNETAAAFRRVVATELPPRLEREIKVITNGILS